MKQIFDRASLKSAFPTAIFSVIMQYFKIEIYVPETHADAVIKAIALAGAGKLGNYDSCCWTTSGIGRFRPLHGSSPFLGTIDNTEFVPETKIEAICAKDCLKNVIENMRKAHPYEEPAFQYWSVEINDRDPHSL